jgi:hypothetical protein
MTDGQTWGLPNAYMPEKELDLLKFAARDLAQSGARSPQVVWCKLLNSDFEGCVCLIAGRNPGAHSKADQQPIAPSVT